MVVLPEPAHPVSRELSETVDWVHELAGSGVQQVLTARTMQSHSALKHDHLVRARACARAALPPTRLNTRLTDTPRTQFSALLRHEVVKDLVCFYSEEKRKFSCVMQLGE